MSFKSLFKKLKYINLFTFLLVTGSTSSFSQSIPDLLDENAHKVTKEIMCERLPVVLKSQNILRKKLGLSLLEENVDTIMRYPHNLKNLEGVSVPSIDFGSWTNIDMRGDVAIVYDFDDHHFLNHVYKFIKENHSVEEFTLGEYALSKITETTIPIFRYMSKNEFNLWKNKDLKTLLSYKPGPEGFWGFNELNTHTSVFKPWEPANINSESFCGVWKLSKTKLIEWSKNNKIAFGLTGERFSKAYEIIILSSVWSELTKVPFSQCSL